MEKSLRSEKRKGVNHMAKRRKKRASQTWIWMTLILFVLLVVLGLKMLNDHAIIDQSWTLQQNWDSLDAWWNGLGFVQDIKGWFGIGTTTT
jgi:hypothetical protein